MKLLILLMLSATFLFPMFSVAEENNPVGSTLTTSLVELGYPSGISFEGDALPNEQTLLFHLPRGMNVRAATLRIVYRGSSQLGQHALLSVAINDLPPQTKEVADDVTREWFLHVPPSELGGGQLKVALRSSIHPDYDHCIDGEPQSGVIHVSANSELVSHLDGVPESLYDAWLTLPEQVVVTVPKGVLSEATFRTALDWITLLQRQHHSVRVTTLPDLGNLVIAPEHLILSTMAHVGGQAWGSRHLWERINSNVGVVNFRGHTFIAATPPYADVQHFASHWQELSNTALIETGRSAAGDRPDSDLPLDQLGLSTVPALLGHKLQCSATITPWNLPPGMRPVSATIHLLLPRTEEKKLFRIYIYLNDMMIRSTRYQGDGSEKEIAISFGSVPRSDTYHLRVDVRDDGKADNIKPSNFYPMQITSQSRVTLRDTSSMPEGFSSVPTALGQGFDLYIPRDYLAEAPRYLPLLGQLLVGFVVAPTEFDLKVIAPGDIPALQRNFIVAGNAPPGEVPLPVHFDQGKVELVDHHDQPLINERHLLQDSVVQLVKSGGIAGLWFRTGEADELPAIDVNKLGGDDVAVYSPDHLILSIDSHQEELVRATYLDAPRWYERLYNQRLLWLLIAWVVLTMSIIYLYAKSKEHRSK